MANPQCPGNGFSPRCSMRSRGLDRWFVLGGVLLSRTLAGAVPSALSGLAVRVRDGAGRFPVAVTTETTTWAVRQCVLVILLSGRLATHTVCGWWCGLGVDRIVDASLYCGCSPPPGFNHWRVGVLLFVSAY